MAESTPYKISSYAKFLLGLACKLTPGDLEAIKLVLAVEDRMRSARREDIRTAAEMFVQLQQIGLLGPRNISFFEEVFPVINRDDLLLLTAKFRELWDTPREVPVPEVTSTPGHARMGDPWFDGELQDFEVFASDNQSVCSSRSRLSSLSDDEKLSIAKKKVKKKKKKRKSSSSGSQGSISNLLAKLKLR